MPINLHATALLTCKQMAAVDQAAIKAGQSGTDLMARAGQAVVDAIQARWQPGRVSVVCGPGNNGGDGFVIARLLKASGWTVRLALLGQLTALPESAQAHAAHWSGPIEDLNTHLLDTDLVVDALFGAGLSRPLSGQAAAWTTALAASQVPVCAVDIPSGVSGDTGEAQGPVAAADLTVTFFRKKIGHVLYPGPDFCGELILADIGIPAATLNEVDIKVAENHPLLWQASLPAMHSTQYKYQRGHVLVLGGATLTGAARLAALAAARIGAGLVTIAAPPPVWAVYAAASFLSAMVRPCHDAASWADMLSDSRHHTMVVGPGAGPDVAPYVTKALETARPVVLDADALTAFSGSPQRLFETIQGPCVLTPHEGEFKRLFAVQGDKLSRTQEAARQAGAIVVHKGADTVIAHPDGRAIVNASGHPALATAGTGDVLAGMIAGLLAQGMDPFLAAAAACWLHGRAGSLAGPGLIADDLPGMLPALLQTQWPHQTI